MGPIINNSCSAIGRIALGVGALRGVETVNGEKGLGLIALSLNYLVLYNFFKPLVGPQRQVFFSVGITIIGGVSTLVEAAFLFNYDTTKEEENPMIQGLHAMNEMFVLAAGVALVVTAIFTTDKRGRIECIIATALYGLSFANKFYQEGCSSEQKEESIQTEVPSCLKEMGKEEVACINRDKLIEGILDVVCSPSQYNNLILSGVPGAGKTTLISYLAYQIKQGKFKTLEGVPVFKTSAQDIIAGARYVGDKEERIKEIFAFLKREKEKSPNRKVILFIDEIWQLIGTGLVEGGTTDIAGTLLTELEDGGMIVIGALTPDDEKHLLKNKAFKDRFDQLNVPDPTQNERVSILRRYLERIENPPLISEQFIKKLVEINVDENKGTREDQKILGKIVSRMGRHSISCDQAASQLGIVFEDVFQDCSS